MSVVKWSLALLLVVCSSQRDVDAGDAALRAHDLPKAEAAYRRALTKTPDLAEALAGLGWTYNLVGQRSAARDAFERCREVAAEHVNCLRGLASLEMGGGRYDAASRLLSRARALQPDDAGVESSTALLALVTGDLATAHERYERLVSRLPDEGEYRLGLGEVLLRRREAKAAMEEAERKAAEEREKALGLAKLLPCC